MRSEFWGGKAPHGTCSSPALLPAGEPGGPAVDSGMRDTVDVWCRPTAGAVVLMFMCLLSRARVQGPRPRAGTPVPS